MDGKREKLNNGETLAAFPVARSSGPHTVRIIETVRIPYGITRQEVPGTRLKFPAVKERVYRFPRLKGTCSPAGLLFPLLEQDRARTLARVNARAGGLWETGAQRLILSRQELRAGVPVWRKASPRSAVKGWRVHAFPLFNRLERVPGVFLSGAAPELLKVANAPAEVRNGAADFLAQMPAGVRNRVRSSSPRWRGTRRHGERKARAVRTVHRARLERFRVKEQRRGASDAKAEQLRRVLGGMTPEQYAAAHLEVARAARGKSQAMTAVLRAFLRRIRKLAAVSLCTLRELLAELRRLRAERETYAGFIAHINAVAFLVFLAELAERLADAEGVPRPPHLLPLPPSAPLAPPA